MGIKETFADNVRTAYYERSGVWIMVGKWKRSVVLQDKKVTGEFQGLGVTCECGRKIDCQKLVIVLVGLLPVKDFRFGDVQSPQRADGTARTRRSKRGLLFEITSKLLNTDDRFGPNGREARISIKAIE